MAVIETRIEQVRRVLVKNKIDCLMVLIGENRFYLSGYSGEDGQFDESAGALFITAKKLILTTDSRFVQQAKDEAPLYEVICYKEGLEKELPNILARLNHPLRLGFEKNRLIYKNYEALTRAITAAKLKTKMIPTERIVESLRIIKNKDEINATKKALNLAEDAFSKLLPYLKIGMCEKEVAWLLEQRVRAAGAQALSFPSIIASGPNAALPHAIPSDRTLKSGETILFDWGAKLNHYCSDISRTIWFGEPDELFLKVFETVKRAQQKAIVSIKAGISSKAVDQVARSYIEKMGFKGKFGHGLGHGTGLAVHEAPRLSPFKDIQLAEGMIVTIEPGIYLPGWGGVRLENQVVVQKNGAKVLNRLDPGVYQFEKFLS
jgi:Xaa-Pro aminopeptidase